MRCLIIVTTLLVVVTGCHRIDTPAPLNPERRWHIYDVAWRRGFSDELTPLSNDWERYRGKLDPFADVPEREAIFRSGYDDGFHQHPEQERDFPEMSYDGGYRNGQMDAWLGKAPNTVTSTFDPEAYARGYGDGFNRRPHAFGRPY